MKFKTSEEIRKEKEAREKNSKKTDTVNEKLREKAARKYAAMAAASAKREATRPAKPKLTLLPGVIVAPALLASKKVIQQVIKAESKFYGGKPVPESTASKKRKALQAAGATGRPTSLEERTEIYNKLSSQVWDEATKQWVKR